MNPAGAPVPLEEQKQPPIPRGPSFSEWEFEFCDDGKVRHKSNAYPFNTPRTLMSDVATLAIMPPHGFLTHNSTFDNRLIVWDSEQWFTYFGRPTMPLVPVETPPVQPAGEFRWHGIEVDFSLSDYLAVGCAKLMEDGAVIIDGIRYPLSMQFRLQLPDGLYFREENGFGYEPNVGIPRLFWTKVAGWREGLGLIWGLYSIQEIFKVPVVPEEKPTETEDATTMLSHLAWLKLSLTAEHIATAGLVVAFVIALVIITLMYGTHP